MALVLVKKVFPRRRMNLVRCFSPKQYDFSTHCYRAVPQRTMNEEKAMYESYLDEHDKEHYINPKEEEKRFQTFCETLRFIDRHNSTTTQSMSMEGQQSEDKEDCGRTDGEVEEAMDMPRGGRTLGVRRSPGLGQRHLFETFVFMNGYKEIPEEEKEKMFEIFRKFLSVLPGRSEGVVTAMFESFIAGHEEFCNTPPEEKEKMFQMFRKFLIFMDGLIPKGYFGKGG